MSNYDNTNRGVLFENDRKETDTQPDMKGSINVDGVEHWFSGWWKDGRNGQFLSVSIGKPKDDQPQQQAPRQAQGHQQPQRRPGQRPPQQLQRPAPQRHPVRSSGAFDNADDDIPY